MVPHHLTGKQKEKKWGKKTRMLLGDTFSIDDANFMIARYKLFEEPEFKGDDVIADLTMRLTQYQYNGENENLKTFVEILAERDIGISVRGRWFAFIDGEPSEMTRTHLMCVLKRDYLDSNKKKLSGAKLDDELDRALCRIHYAAVLYYCDNKTRAMLEHRKLKLGEPVK